MTMKQEKKRIYLQAALALIALLAVLLGMQPRIRLAFWAVKAQC